MIWTPYYSVFRQTSGQPTILAPRDCSDLGTDWSNHRIIHMYWSLVRSQVTHILRSDRIFHQCLLGGDVTAATRANSKRYAEVFICRRVGRLGSTVLAVLPVTYLSHLPPPAPGANSIDQPDFLVGLGTLGTTRGGASSCDSLDASFYLM